MTTTPPDSPAPEPAKPSPAPAKPAPRGVTSAQFLEQYPLYRLWKGYWDTPQTISRDCKKCGKETTWKFKGDLTGPTSGPYKLLAYDCFNCGQDNVKYLVVTMQSGDQIKVGQFPMQSVRVPSSIEKRLGPSADFYRKALTSRNEGYGIAAVAYFRRVVEDKTNELIDIVAEAAEAYSVPADEVKKIQAAKNEKTYEDKLKVAAEAIPEVLKPDGANPFQAMYSILSAGIHTQSEEECLQIADDTREIFDYLFDRLRTEITERTTFVSRMKGILGKRGQRRTPETETEAKPKVSG
jgi:hypothetical protein